jgi:hypothetical protein
MPKLARLKFNLVAMKLELTEILMGFPRRVEILLRYYISGFDPKFLIRPLTFVDVLCVLPVFYDELRCAMPLTCFRTQFTSSDI